MHPDLLHILSSQDQPIDNEKLIAYLTGSLSAAESREIEAQLAASDMDNEALEGLMLVQDKRKLSGMQKELNTFLKEKISQPKRKKIRKELLSWQWLTIATGVLILFIILCYYLIHYLSQ